MDGQMPGETYRDYLRRIIEHKTGRPLAEIVCELYHGQGWTSSHISQACTQLAGEEVAVAVAEEWLYELGLADSAERWAAMVPRLKTLLDNIIEEEVDRRLKDRLPDNK